MCIRDRLEPKRLLTADLSGATTPTATYLLHDRLQESVARDYLSNQLDTADLQVGEVDLELVEIQRGLASTVTRFRQTVHGIPVADAWVTTIQDGEGEFALVHDQSQEALFDTTCSPDKETISFEVSEQLAMDYAGATRSFAPTRGCLLYTSPSPRDRTRSRMPSSA